MIKKRHILIVDDEPIIRDLIQEILRMSDVVFIQAGTYDQALKEIHARSYDTIILDNSLPDGRGLDLVPLANKKTKSLFMITSDAHNLEFQQEAERLDIDKIFAKPFSAMALFSTVYEDKARSNGK